MITKKPYEEYFRYYDFKRKRERGCLDDDEKIETTEVIVCDLNNEDDDYPEMVGDVTIETDTVVSYLLKGGEKGRKYKIIIRIVTSAEQKFENNKPIRLAII